MLFSSKGASSAANLSTHRCCGVEKACLTHHSLTMLAFYNSLEEQREPACLRAVRSSITSGTRLRAERPETTLPP